MTPCFTCPTVLEPLIHKRLNPILIEVDFDFTMDLNQIRDRITERTKAILVTHFFGIPSNILEIREIAAGKGIAIIEDCAQTFCAEVNGLKLGSIGDLAFTSFQNDKPLSLGGGSILLVNNEELVNRLDTEVAHLQLNSLIEEECAFLSLLFFYLNTEASNYDKYIEVNEYNSYFKQHSSERENILSNLDHGTIKNRIRKTKSNRYNILYKLKPFWNILLKSFRTTDKPQFHALLMNSFSLNLLVRSMDSIKESNELRIRNGTTYIDNLRSSEKIFTPIRIRNVPYLRYCIVCKNKAFYNTVKKFLNIKGYEVGNFAWSTSINKLLGVREVYSKCDLLSSNILNLPSHPYVNEGNILDICDIINALPDS